MISRADFAAFADRNFRRYWTGQAVSFFGDGMIPVVTAFAVLQAGGSPAALGLVLAAGTGARVVATLVGGVVADRRPRRTVMVGADTVRAAVQVAVGLLMLAGVLGPLGLAAANVAYGVAAGMFVPASRGFVPAVVERRLLQQANALTSITRSACMVLGPAIAGAVIPVGGTGPVYLVDGATFAVNVAMLLRVTVREEPRPRDRSMVADLVEGWREVVARRWLRSALVVHSLWNLGIAAFFVLGPVVADRDLGGAAAWGAVSAALSVGAFCGGYVALRWRPGRPLVVGNLALVLGVLPLLALALGAPVVVLVLSAVVFNAGLTVLNELWTVSVQQLVPDEALSRVTSWDWLVSLVTLPVGYALVGPVSRAAGSTATLLFGAAATSLPVLVLCALPSVRGVRMRPDGIVHQAGAEAGVPEAAADPAGAAPAEGGAPA